MGQAASIVEEDEKSLIGEGNPSIYIEDGESCASSLAESYDGEEEGEEMEIEKGGPQDRQERVGGEDGPDPPEYPTSSTDVSFAEPTGPLLVEKDSKKTNLDDDDSEDSDSSDGDGNGSDSIGNQDQDANLFSSIALVHNDMRSTGSSIPSQSSSTYGEGDSDKALEQNGNGITNGNGNGKAMSAATSPSTGSITGAVEVLYDLLMLTNTEIKMRLHGIIDASRDAIRAADEIVRKENLCQADEMSWYQEDASVSAPVSTPKSMGGSEYSRDSSNMEYRRRIPRSHMQMALFMLKTSPELKTLRFKMVPAKMSEPRFWNAVFYLLLTDEEKLAIRDRYRCQSYANGDGDGDDENVDMDFDGADDKFKNILAEKNAQIVELQKKLSQTEKALAEAIENGGKCVIAAHKGTWVMDKESQEFLVLDEEIKARLREGKQARLNDVHNQMKFILDSDNVEDTHGKWDCCGQDDYRGQCNA